MRWRVVFWMVLVVVTWLMLIELTPKTGGWPYWDKVQHILVFAGLTVLAILGYRRRWRTVALGLLLYGVLIEGLQTVLTVTRQASVGDWLADTIGILFAIACYWMIQRRLRALT